MWRVVPGIAPCDAGATVSANWPVRGSLPWAAGTASRFTVWGHGEGRDGALWAGSHWQGFSAVSTVSVSMVVMHSGGANYLPGKRLG